MITGEAFDIKYQNLFEGLKKLDTDIDIRMKYLREREDYDTFVVDALFAFNPANVNEHLPNEKYEIEVITKTDSIAFDEAFREAVKGYKTGEAGFRSLMGKIYNSKRKTRLGAEAFEERFGKGTIVGSDEKKNTMNKLINTLEEFLAKIGKDVTKVSESELKHYLDLALDSTLADIKLDEKDEQAIVRFFLPEKKDEDDNSKDIILKEDKKKALINAINLLIEFMQSIGKDPRTVKEKEVRGYLELALKNGLDKDIAARDIKMVCDFVLQMKGFVSLNKLVTEDGKVELQDLVVGEKESLTNAGIENLIGMRLDRGALDIILEGWSPLADSTNKTELDYYKALISSDILRILKTYINHEGKECFFMTEPAGDYEIYKYLEPVEEELNEKILHKRYINSAFYKEPGSLYDIYAWFVRKGFSFNHIQIAASLGRSEGTISKNYKKYQSEFLLKLKSMINWVAAEET